MGLEALAVARQRYVDKVLVIPEVLERGGDAVLVVVPAQTEMLEVAHHAAGFGRHCPACETKRLFIVHEESKRRRRRSRGHWV